MVVFAWGLWRRYQLWTAGGSADERLGDWFRRFQLLLKFVLRQRGVNREKHARIFHMLILWGFIVLLFTTTMVAIDHDLGIDIYRGRFYLAVTILSDLFGLALWFGVCYAFYHRYVDRPDRLHTTSADFLMLVLLGLLVVQGFALEGMRIYATDDPWALYSPVGYLFSLSLWNLSTSAVGVLHYGMWWFHAVSVFVFIALLPYTKFFHILSSSANLFFREIHRPKGALPYPGDIEQIMEKAMSDEGDGEFRIGVSSVEDLSWKQRLDLDACTSCGRCQAVCPAYNSGKVLSPKWLILDTRAHMLKLHTQDVLKEGSGANMLDTLDATLLQRLTLDPQSHDENGPNYKRAENELVQNSVKQLGGDWGDALAGTVMDEDVFWSCTTCRACMEVCPVGIEHVDLIVEARRSMALMEGNIPSEAQSSLRAIETRGNPFGPAEERTNWADGLDVPILEEGQSVEVVYWVGCVSSYDKRKQKIARAVTEILNASGISWGIMGNREHCSGDPARRLGEENLFQNSAKQNIALLSAISFNTLIANCPHCFNSLKNEYGDVGDLANGRSVEILHHSHFIKQLIEEKKITVEQNFEDEVTFHDPCYLGRYNDTYDEPREVLVQIGAKKMPEMEQSREKGLCCGAGGGHYWFDMKVGERINTQRVDQAAATGAKTVATACPFCMQMLEDGVKQTDRENQLEVQDIAELVASALVRSSSSV